MSAEDGLGEHRRATRKAEITATNWKPQGQMQMRAYLEIPSGWDSEATREVLTSPDLEADGWLALSDAFLICVALMSELQVIGLRGTQSNQSFVGSLPSVWILASLSLHEDSSPATICSWENGMRGARDSLR